MRNVAAGDFSRRASTARLWVEFLHTAVVLGRPLVADNKAEVDP